MSKRKPTRVRVGVSLVPPPVVDERDELLAIADRAIRYLSNEVSRLRNSARTPDGDYYDAHIPTCRVQIRLHC